MDISPLVIPLNKLSTLPNLHYKSIFYPQVNILKNMDYSSENTPAMSSFAPEVDRLLKSTFLRLSNIFGDPVS